MLIREQLKKLSQLEEEYYSKKKYSKIQTMCK